MLRVAICDDEAPIREQIANTIVEYCNNNSVTYNINVFSSGVELCQFLKSRPELDLIFLDIEMDEQSGIEVGNVIRDEMDNQTVQIVFVSWKTNYCMNLFEIRPMNFLVKPLKEEDIISVIQKAIALAKRYETVFTYKNGCSTCKIAAKDILYFESKNKMIHLVSLNSKDIFHGTLDEIHASLNELNFMRIHKSYLINTQRVKIFLYDKVIMVNDEALIISQSKRKEIRAKLSDSIGGKKHGFI